MILLLVTLCVLVVNVIWPMSPAYLLGVWTLLTATLFLGAVVGHIQANK